MRDGPPNWFAQWLAEQRAEEEDKFWRQDEYIFSTEWNRL